VRSAEVAIVRGAIVRGGVLGMISEGLTTRWLEPGCKLDWSKVRDGGVIGAGPLLELAPESSTDARVEIPFPGAGTDNSVLDLIVARGLMCRVGERGRLNIDAG
jgi:hypothetical protein